MADVAGVHDDEAAREAVLARPVVLVRLGPDRVRVDPVLDHADAVGRDALLDEAPPHRLADRHHPVGPAEIEGDRGAERAEQEPVADAPDGDRRLREHVLHRDDERGAEAPGERPGEVADERRVRVREHHVRPARAQPAQAGADEVGGVVERPERETPAREGGRRHAQDPHAVPLVAAGRLVVRRPGDDRHVPVAGEPLAELGEQPPVGLRTRPVVLVEREQAGPGGHGRRIVATERETDARRGSRRSRSAASAQRSVSASAAAHVTRGSAGTRKRRLSSATATAPTKSAIAVATRNVDSGRCVSARRPRPIRATRSVTSGSANSAPSTSRGGSTSLA